MTSELERLEARARETGDPYDLARLHRARHRRGIVTVEEREGRRWARVRRLLARALSTSRVWPDGHVREVGRAERLVETALEMVDATGTHTLCFPGAERLALACCRRNRYHEMLVLGERAWRGDPREPKRGGPRALLTRLTKHKGLRLTWHFFGTARELLVLEPAEPGGAERGG